MDIVKSNLKMNEQVFNERISNLRIYNERGKLMKSIGLTYEGYLPGASVGSIVRIVPPNSKNSTELENKSDALNKNQIFAEVIGFKDKRVILMPLSQAHGLSSNSKIVLSQHEAKLPVGDFLLGRVIDGNGAPLDKKGNFTLDQKNTEYKNLYGDTVNPLDRQCITEPLDLGIRAMNGLLTCGKGQRLGIMAGSGVGKSVLLGMIARHTKADVNVIALIGERGREVNEFLEKDLGPEGLKKSIVVVATSDQSPLLRMRGAFAAATIADYFADQGLDVLLLMDSVTRFAMAQREIGLSMGEPPASKGYTPSVFSTLPKLLERAGKRSNKGSITGLYTVLVEGDDMDEPIADSARSILDGHIVLTRALANRNHYPAIDVGASISRVMSSVISSSHKKIAAKIRDLMATYTANEDLINIGAYQKGTNPHLDQAILVIDRIKNFLKQDVNEVSSFQEAVAQLDGILRVLQ